MMPLDLSEIDDSPSMDGNDVVVTMPVTKPAERHWKRNRKISDSGSGSHPIVVVPSDSEDDSDDDIAIVSVCPPPPVDNDDCIVESYQPASETFCTVNQDPLLTVPPASDDDAPVDVSCANSDLDLQFATYNQSADQPGTFLVHDVPNLGTWIFSSESASSVKQPDVNSVPNTCSTDSPVLACSSTFGVPLSIPSANKAHSQPTFGSEPVKFNTVQLQTGGILFDMGAAKVSANIDKASVLSLSAQIQSSDDRHSTTVSFVGSISDRKTPANSDFVSVQTGVKHPPDDLNLSLVTVSPVASPDVVSSDKVNSYCQTASVSLNVNANVDAALNDTVNGLLRQMSCQKRKKVPKPDPVPNAEDIKQENQMKDLHAVGNKSVAHRCVPVVGFQSSSVSHSSCRVPTLSGSLALKKRKIKPWTSPYNLKTPRLPLPPSDSSADVKNVTSTSGQPCPLLQACCCCESLLAAEKLSHCLLGHPCCGTCLQKHVKSVLTSSVKVDMVCRKLDCDAIYLAAELRNSLPEMVVEILQEKLTQKLSEDVDRLPLTSNQSGVGSTNNVSLSSNHSSDSMTNPRCEEGLYEFPKNWVPMDDSERYRKVEVEMGSEEYVWVSSTFHQTMSWPRAHILHIHRVQNRTLWQFYVVKRHQMQRDCISGESVNEKFLFHGTSRNAVDAICVNNFDWRVCGSHGTVYGQGSYFATEASYSHMYTDAASSGRTRIHQSSLFGLGMRTIPISYRRHVAGPSLAAAFVNVPGLYPVGPAPPAHQPKAVISPQVNVQPAHQPASGLPSSHVGPSSLPIPDMSTFVPPIFRIPSVTYAGSQPSVAASGAVWGQNGSCSRCPVLAGNASPVVDPNMQSNHVGGVLSNRPTSFSTACPHKSLFLPPPMAHRVLPSLPSSGSRSSMVPGGSGTHPPLPPQFTTSSHSHHTMFFARVLVGRTAIGRSDYRTPPPLDPSDHYGRCFDSCINRSIDPSIFVIFNSAQCYPEYIVEYANRSKSADPL